MDTQTKQDRYELLCKQVESLIAGETNMVGMLANVSAAMKTMFPEEYFWVGFYLVSPTSKVGLGSSSSSPTPTLPSREGEVSHTGGDLEGALLLGPFQGTVACYEIPFGKGVCGAAWKERRTLVVPDVEEFPGHIACSSLSRSEIVVPIFLPDEEEEDGRGEVWGVIDIDSTELGTFDDVDAEYLERIAKIISEHVAEG
jgi:GAF domain-containing protein